MDIRRQFGPAADDATTDGGLLGGCRQFRAIKGDLGFAFETGNVIWLTRGTTISAKPALALSL